MSKRHQNVLDEHLFGLLTSYLCYGYQSMASSLRDRFVIECLLILSSNIKHRGKNRLGLQAAYALMLGQSMISSLHEELSRSQIEEIINGALYVL